MFVKGLLAMRDKHERIVTEAFGGEKAAQKKLQVRVMKWGYAQGLGWRLQGRERT